MRVRVVPSSEITDRLDASFYVINPRLEAEDLVEKWRKKYPFMAKGTPAGVALREMIGQKIAEVLERDRKGREIT
jgi:hypothetical protein